MPIRATKSGWLIATKLIKETDKYYHVIDLPEKENKLMKIHKDDESCRLFDNTGEALEWIGILDEETE